jgi:hypothetical protein
MYDPTKETGLMDFDNGVFGPIHESYCKQHWRFHNPPMLNASTHNFANHRQGGASTRRLRDNPSDYAGPLLNAYVARNGPRSPLPRWPKHPNENGHLDHAFDKVRCQRRMQMRRRDDWRSSGEFLLDASLVPIDAILDPGYTPLYVEHRPLPVGTPAEGVASPAYSSDVSGEFAACAEQSKNDRDPLPEHTLPEHIVPVPPGCPGFDYSDDKYCSPGGRSYSPVTPISDAAPDMCDATSQTSPIDSALAVTDDSTDHAKPLEAPALAAIPARTEAPSATALATTAARTVNLCFTTLDGSQHSVQVAHNATVWSTSASIAEVTGIARYHQQWVIDGEVRNFNSTEAISNAIGKEVAIMHNACNVSWTFPQSSPPPCPPPPLPPCSLVFPKERIHQRKRRKGTDGTSVSTDDDHCSLMLELPPQVGGVAQVLTSQRLDTQLSPQSPRQSLLPDVDLSHQSVARPSSDVDLSHQSEARLSMLDRIQNVFGSSTATDESPPVDPLGAFLESDKMVIAAATSSDSETMSFSNCEPSVGHNGSSHRSLTMLAELKKPIAKGSYLAYQETLDTGAGLDYMVMEVMEALIEFCPNVIVEKKRYAVPLTTVAADEGQMQRVGFIKVKVIARNDKGQDVEVRRRYEILTKCILIAIRGIQGQSEDRGFLDVHNQDSSATMNPETYCVRDPATNIFPLVRANNHLEPSF